MGRTVKCFWRDYFELRKVTRLSVHKCEHSLVELDDRPYRNRNYVQDKDFPHRSGMTFTSELET